MKKTVVKKLLIGLDVPDFCDQDYLRDRDEVVPLFEGETEADAIALWIKERHGWLKTSEHKYIKVFKEGSAKDYLGHELFRSEMYE